MGGKLSLNVSLSRENGLDHSQWGCCDGCRRKGVVNVLGLLPRKETCIINPVSYCLQMLARSVTASELVSQTYHPH